MSARHIIAALDGRWHGRAGTARCPAHDDRSPSLSVCEQQGRVLVRCHAGCAQETVIHALAARGLWGPMPRPIPYRLQAARGADDGSRVEAVRRTWSEARASAAGSPVEIYLRSRGVTIAPPPALRFHPALRHGPSGLRLPAMVAAVQGRDGRLIGVHRTFLQPDGRAKAAVTPARMMLGRCGGGAVRLAAPGATLAVAEGIETALSVQQATGIPTWAALSAGGLEALILPPLPHATDIFIAADHDPRGLAAARTAAARWHAAGRRVRIAVSPWAGSDFNDLLLRTANDAAAPFGGSAGLAAFAEVVP